MKATKNKLSRLFIVFCGILGMSISAFAEKIGSEGTVAILDKYVTLPTPLTNKWYQFGLYNGKLKFEDLFMSFINLFDMRCSLYFNLY